MAKSSKEKKSIAGALDDAFDWDATLNGQVSESSFIVSSFFPPEAPLIERLGPNRLPVSVPHATVPTLEINGGQTEDKQGTNRVLNGGQTEDKQGTNGSLKNETGDKEGLKRGTSETLNRGQTEDKQGTNSHFKTLRGHESDFLWLTFYECRNAGDLLTPPLTLERITSELKTTKQSAKTTIKRVVKKGFLTREGSGTGRGGFSRFRMVQDLYHAMLLQSKQGTNGGQTGDKQGLKQGTEWGTSVSSSSEFLDLVNLKSTTSTPGLVDKVSQEPANLSFEWKSIDLNPLESIGLKPSHTLQVARQGKISPQETQESIHHFAFDLKRNGKATEINGAPLNYFMGILKKGTPYAPPHNYESPEDEARRIYRDRLKELEEKRAIEIREIYELHFRKWERELTQEECNKLLPEYAKKAGPMRESFLQNHFAEHVWPGIEGQVPGLRSVPKPVSDIQKQC